MFKSVEYISNKLWGAPIITMLIVLGLILSFKTSFFQFRKLGHILKTTFGEVNFRNKKGTSGFKAMCMALGGTIGVGNIAGVSTAIMTGGPGSIFWMWVSGFIGMIVKYFEVALAVKFRQKLRDGEYVGGPMYYMANSNIKILKPIAYVFAACCVCSSFFIGNIAQSNAVSVGFQTSFGLRGSFVCAILVLLLVPSILGKDDKIKNISSVLVPFMSVLYLAVCVMVILLNVKNLPNTIKLIFVEAFSPKSTISGVGAYGVSRAISVGFSRGLFTNEAGLGSAPIAHASNPDAEPHVQGMWGIAEVFVDTILVCSLTAFAVLGSDAYLFGTELNGLNLTIAAFSESIGEIAGKGIIALSVALFAYASMVAWNFYGRTALFFIFKSKKMILLYSVLFIFCAFFGSAFNEQSIVLLSDFFNAPLILINLPVIALLYPLCLKK